MKHLILSMSLLALVSCKNSEKKEIITEKEVVEQPVKATDDHHDHESSSVYDNSWTSEIKLDNGAKWNANSETTNGVAKMQKSIAEESATTLEEYHKLAERLNVDKNYVIKNCTMKGASHDNLHVWLLPLMAKIDALSETESLEDAARIKHSIDENIGAYYNYFQ